MRANELFPSRLTSRCVRICGSRTNNSLLAEDDVEFLCLRVCEELLAVAFFLRGAAFFATFLTLAMIASLPNDNRWVNIGEE